MLNIATFLPGGFRLRAGGGGGDPRDGLCYMETVALIAGEPIGDRPACASPVLTTYGVVLNDRLCDDERQALLPLAWAMAGTRSGEHEGERLRILKEGVCLLANMVLSFYADRWVRKVMADLRDYGYWAAKVGYESYAAKVFHEFYAAKVVHAAIYLVDYADRAEASGELRRLFVARAIYTLREAIKAGPHGGLPDEDVIQRIDSVCGLLPVV